MKFFCLIPVFENLLNKEILSNDATKSNILPQNYFLQIPTQTNLSIKIIPELSADKNQRIPLNKVLIVTSNRFYWDGIAEVNGSIVIMINDFN